MNIEFAGGDYLVIYMLKRDPLLGFVGILILLSSFLLFILPVLTIILNGFTFKSIATSSLYLIISYINFINVLSIFKNFLKTYFDYKFTIKNLLWRIYYIKDITAKDVLSIMDLIEENNYSETIIIEATYLVKNIQDIAGMLPDFNQLNWRMMVKDKNTLLHMRLML